jgi:hypothetical protein
LPGAGRRRGRERGARPAVLGGLAGAGPDLGGLLLADEGDRGLDQIADHRLDVAADVADLGELVASTLTNGRLRERASRRAISVFPTPVGPIMMMFFGVDLVAQLAATLLPAPAVAERDGDRALGARWPTM